MFTRASLLADGRGLARVIVRRMRGYGISSAAPFDVALELFVGRDFRCTQAGNGSSLSEPAHRRYRFGAGRRRIGAAGTSHAAGGAIGRALQVAGEHDLVSARL